MFNKLFNDEKIVKISPSIVIFTTAFLGILFSLYYIRSILTMLFAAVIIMAAINPGVRKLERKLKVPRVLGILLMYSAVIITLGSLVALIIPPLAQELAGMTDLTKMLDLGPIQEAIKGLRFSISEISGLISNFSGSLNAIWSVVNSTFSTFFTVFGVVVMSIYLLVDRENLYKKASWFTRDKKHLKIAQQFVDDLEIQLGGWIRGQMILMTVIGVVIYIGLLLLGIPYALPIALLAGFLEILPNLGPTIAAIPAIILAYVYGGWVMAGATVIFYIVVQQLENNLIVPKIMKENADVNPLATIITILIGLKVGGIVGALLSVPVYIMLRAVYGIWRKNFLK